MIQIDTTNILFICGGAFDGIVPIIESRTGKKNLGFGAELTSKTPEGSTDALKKAAPGGFDEVRSDSGICRSSADYGDA